MYAYMKFNTITMVYFEVFFLCKLNENLLFLYTLNYFDFEISLFRWTSLSLIEASDVVNVQGLIPSSSWTYQDSTQLLKQDNKNKFMITYIIDFCQKKKKNAQCKVLIPLLHSHSLHSFGKQLQYIYAKLPLSL